MSTSTDTLREYRVTVDGYIDSMHVSTWSVVQEFDTGVLHTWSGEVVAELRHWARAVAAPLPHGRRWVIQFDTMVSPDGGTEGSMYLHDGNYQLSHQGDGPWVSWRVEPVVG